MLVARVLLTVIAWGRDVHHAAGELRFYTGELSLQNSPYAYARLLQGSQAQFLSTVAEDRLIDEVAAQGIRDALIQSIKHASRAHNEVAGVQGRRFG